MRRNAFESAIPAPHVVALLVLALLATPTPAPAAAAARTGPIAALGGHDIGSLMRAAESRYDLSLMDAVILLDDETVAIGKDGDLRTTVHTIVWFSTELGLDTYADVRVPYNTETSTLEVHALRTWRDGRWWPDASKLSPTAMVETTPHSIQSADDYTTMRETVLLHDGVELPCIVETAYTIVERGGAVPGVDGRWMIRRMDPAVLTRLTITSPSDMELSYSLGNGAPAPTINESLKGVHACTWEVELSDRLPRPLTEEPSAYAPYVVWSTWQSWDSLGGSLSSSIDRAAVLTAALADSVASMISDLPFDLPRAEAVVAFVARNTRPVSYDDSFWRLRPRQAGRTWETAYGHRLDRAVLATALLRAAGCSVKPVFMSADRSAVDPSVPALAWFGGLTLRVEAEGLLATFDPASGRLSQGEAEYSGRTLWLAQNGERPRVITGDDSEQSLYAIAVALEPDGEGGWAGSGLIRTSGALSVFRRIVGLEGEADSFVKSVTASVLAGATVEQHGVSELFDGRAAVGFSLEIEAPEPDDIGRTSLVVGDPDGGMLAAMPGDVHVYSEHRDSPVLLPGPLSQTVIISIDPGEMEEVLVPEPTSLGNEVGSFSLSVERRNNGSLVLTRSLTIGTPTEGADAERADAERSREEGQVRYHGLMISAAQWPMLRQLLLEESDPRHRTILLK
ncbi:MAG: DUF3857 domain-containing protein [Candidatus Eisenbacteria bacterium]|nr:DUF3857 domain-containing protein [Candidatus Eisenbacteria bacterium]